MAQPYSQFDDTDDNDSPVMRYPMPMPLPTQEHCFLVPKTKSAQRGALGAVAVLVCVAYAVLLLISSASGMSHEAMRWWPMALLLIVAGFELWSVATQNEAYQHSALRRAQRAWAVQVFLAVAAGLSYVLHSLVLAALFTGTGVIVALYSLAETRHISVLAGFVHLAHAIWLLAATVHVIAAHAAL